MKNFKQFITEEKEMKVGDYQTTHHYMCPSAIKFLKKHMRMDHDIKDLEKIAKLSDGVFKIEADVEESGKVTDEPNVPLATVPNALIPEPPVTEE